MTSMLRIGAIFIAVCMVLIAASLGAVLYLGLKLDIRSSAIVALAALIAMALYNTIASRLSDRRDLGDQIADLSRGTADLARQVAEISRRVNGMESRVDLTVDRARGVVDPLAVEIGELGGLVKQLAETVAGHEQALRHEGVLATPPAPLAAAETQVADGTLALSESDAVGGTLKLSGISRDGIGAMIAAAIDSERIDLYLQPIVTLPQRKVRYYEALSRLRTEEGDVIPAGDFIDVAESCGLLPKLDNILMFRCVQVMRRLQMKNRDVGLFCNIGPATLSDAVYFKQFLDFMDANRALGPSMMFEFTQSAYRAFGPLEHEAMASLAERGFRFSLDHVADLRFEPKELADRGFRALKVSAKLLLNRATGAQSDIHPADLADLLARSGIDLIAERIESESMVIDLLDYDVRFGQGFLFSAPRPVRAEALSGAAAESDSPPAADDASSARIPAVTIG
jgi:cyclic-di-GMP phosphodiesterase TipF (flagellum assembly factor)